jgi:hypothetical protein
MPTQASSSGSVKDAFKGTVIRTASSPAGPILLIGAVGVGGFILYKSGIFTELMSVLKGASNVIGNVNETLGVVSGTVNKVVSSSLNDVNQILPYLDPVSDVQAIINAVNGDSGIVKAAKTQASLATYPLVKTSSGDSNPLYDLTPIWPGAIAITLPGGQSQDWQLINGPNSTGNYTPKYLVSGAYQNLWLGKTALPLPIGNAALLQTFMYALGWQGRSDQWHQGSELPFLTVTPTLPPGETYVDPPINWDFTVSQGWSKGSTAATSVGGWFAGDYITSSGGVIEFGGSLVNWMMLMSCGWKMNANPIAMWRWQDGRYALVYSLSTKQTALASNVNGTMAAAAPTQAQLTTLRQKGLIAIDIGAWYPIGQRPTFRYT